MMQKKQLVLVGIFLALSLCACMVVLFAMIGGENDGGNDGGKIRPTKSVPLECGTYSSLGGGYRMVVSEGRIDVYKGDVRFIMLKNRTKKFLSDPDDSKRHVYVVESFDDGGVKLIRCENPPFDRKEYVFRKVK